MDLNRFAVCTYGFNKTTLDVACRVTADAGLTKLDVWGRAPHFSLAEPGCRAQEVEAKAREYGLTIEVLGTYPGAGFSSDDEAERAASLDEWKQTVDAAAELGAKAIRVRPGEGEDPSIIPTILPYLREGAAHAEAKGVKCGMENHGGSLARDPDRCMELCRGAASDAFGVLYDPCNLLHAGVDPHAAYEQFGQHIVHVHLKDGRHGADGTFQRVVIGDGEVNVKGIIERFDADGYTGPMSLEYEMWDIEPIETGLARWADIVRTW